ncbi:hypothetical protein RIF29_29532 [Crotalaria pallida]|uniref:Uncharacterized protein n=1 Tax=Crotalaria pallida TaxID=3830 RepID=A0AAN9ELI8_CROPI
MIVLLPASTLPIVKFNAMQSDKNSKAIFQVDQDADDNLKLQELEEKDVITAVVKVLSNRFDPKQSVSLDKLHAEMVRKYSFVWDQIKVRKYLTSGDWPGSESKGNRWYGLLMLLKKYPERFTIVTKSNDGMDNPVVCFL